MKSVRVASSGCSESVGVPSVVTRRLDVPITASDRLWALFTPAVAFVALRDDFRLRSVVVFPLVLLFLTVSTPMVVLVPNRRVAGTVCRFVGGICDGLWGTS